MLQTMRHLAQSWVFKGLMLFLVVSFGIWGIGDIFHGNPLQRTVATTGKLAISVQALDHAFEQALARARQMFGPEFTAQQAREIGLLDQTLDNLIEHADVEQEVRKLGIDISDRTMLEKMAALPQFQDKNGKFDKNLLRQMAEQSGLGEAGFVDAARKEMAQQQLFDALQSEGKIPQTVVDDVYRARAQKRILDVVTVKNAAFTDIPAPDDKTLNDFYQKNATQFMAPEYRSLTIASLSTDDVAKDISVSDDDLKKAYDSKAAELAHPERRDLLQVVMQDENKATQLAAAAKASGNLAAAAKSTGHDAVPLDQMEQKTVLPELADKVFALQAGQISAPIKSALGWHVVQVKKIYPAGKPDFDSVKDQLRADIRRDQAIESVTRTVNNLDDALAAGRALEDIADEMKLRLVKIPAVDAEGKMPDGKDPAELPDRDDVLKSAFGQGSGETSPILDDKQGHYIVVRTDQVTPSAVPPFDKIKDRVAAAWKAAEQARRAGSEAETIAKGMREGKAASTFAAQTGVEVRVSKPISLLGASDPDVPETVLPQVFKLKKGEAVTMPLPDSQLVLRLAQLVEADPATDNTGRNTVAGQLKNLMPKELTEQYTKYLRVLFPVETNQSLLETLRQQGG